MKNFRNIKREQKCFARLQFSKAAKVSAQGNPSTKLASSKKIFAGNIYGGDCVCIIYKKNNRARNKVSNDGRRISVTSIVPFKKTTKSLLNIRAIN